VNHRAADPGFPEQEAEFVGSAVLEFALIARIGPDGLESGVAMPVQLGENLLSSITVLYFCGMNRKSVDRREGFECNVALTATYLLAGIAASGSPCFVVVTYQLSRTAALAEGSWPAARRISSRSASWTRSRVPFILQLRKWNQTTLQGGKACGSMRHEHLTLAW